MRGLSTASSFADLSQYITFLVKVLVIVSLWQICCWYNSVPTILLTTFPLWTFDFCYEYFGQSLTGNIWHQPSKTAVDVPSCTCCCQVKWLSKQTSRQNDHHKCLEYQKIASVEELQTLHMSTKPRTSDHRLPWGERHRKRKCSMIFLKGEKRDTIINKSREYVERFQWPKQFYSWNQTSTGTVPKATLRDGMECTNTSLSWAELILPVRFISHNNGYL